MSTKYGEFSHITVYGEELSQQEYNELTRQLEESDLSDAGNGVLTWFNADYLIPEEQTVVANSTKAKNFINQTLEELEA